MLKTAVNSPLRKPNGNGTVLLPCWMVGPSVFAGGLESKFVGNQKKGVLAKGFFAEIRRFLSHSCLCIICTATWHPMWPLATSPYLSALLVCLSSICYFKGCHFSWWQAHCRTTCELAEPECSTAFDKNEKPLVQE